MIFGGIIVGFHGSCFLADESDERFGAGDDAAGEKPFGGSPAGFAVGACCYGFGVGLPAQKHRVQVGHGDE